MPTTTKKAAPSPGSSTNVIGAADTDPREPGFKVGNRAPSAKYAPMGVDGQPDLGKLSDSPVKGMGVQVVAEGVTITQALFDQLNPPADDEADES